MSPRHMEIKHIRSKITIILPDTANIYIFISRGDLFILQMIALNVMTKNMSLLLFKNSFYDSVVQLGLLNKSLKPMLSRQFKSYS